MGHEIYTCPVYFDNKTGTSVFHIKTWGNKPMVTITLEALALLEAY